MVFFPNEKLELWSYTESQTDYNAYYEPQKEYKLQKVVECDFQVMTPSDSMKEFGEIIEDTYKVYINHDVEVDASMVLRIQGKPDTYSITGAPIDNNHLPSVKHKKLVLKKQRKPVKLTVVETDD